LDKQLRSLIDTAYDIAASYALLRHDLMGRLYHQLLLGKLVKYYATLYTSIPAARLLARLLINLPSRLECANLPPRFGDKPLKVVDFACGSGTLLSAVYKEIDAKHRVDSTKPEPTTLHKYLVEDVLWGFDVLLHAAHLTTLTLFLHNPFSPVVKSKIYVLPMGVFGKPETAHLGSLDFLRFPKISPEGRLIGGAIGVQKVSVSEQETESEKLPNFHICIMNPPFTRSVGGNLLFGSLPKEERKKLQKELGKLLKDKGLSGIGQAGLGGSFTFLADTYLEEDGRLGLVLPKAVLAGVSWRQIRELLLKKYHIEYIISSFEGPNDWNFSENTSLSEILLVARKVKKRKKGNFTIFVNFWSKPKGEIESIFVGSLLLDLYDSAKIYDISNANASPYHLRLRGKKIGEAYSARLDNTDFEQYQLFAQAELNRIVVLLRQGTIYTPDEGIVGRVPLTTLNNFVRKIGPDVKQVHNAFKKGKYSPTSTYHALWGHDSSLIRTIMQKPNASLEPRNNNLARRAWEGSGKLLVVERAWLSTYRVFSCITPKNVLSNVWWPITTKKIKIKDGSLDSEEVDKILTLWFNSTFGTILLLSIAEITRGAWVKFKKEPISNLLVPDLFKITKSKAETLVNLHDEICLQDLKPLPTEFAKPNVRKKIDDTFTKILGIEAKLHELYNLLARDPTITAQPLK
jgi:hypothetical protein